MTIKEFFNTYFPITKRRRNIKDYVATGGFDGAFLAIVLIILTIGLLMMFSASYVYSWYNEGDPYYFIKHQLFYAALGLAAMFIVSKIRYDVFEDLATLAYIFAIILLIYVLINPYVIPGKEDFKRWIKVPGIGTFQPSEIAKLAVIMLCAWSMEKSRRIVETKWWAIIPYAGVIGVTCVLVIAENHLSGTILIFLIGAAMIWFSGYNKKYYFGIAAVLIIIALLAFNTDMLKEYAGQRIDIWQKLLHNEDLTLDERQGEGWQILQSIYAIGSGGVFGLGFGNSKQKHLYLPEPQNDFIYAIVCEELGYVRAVIIMLLFLILILEGFRIALACKKRFGQLLVLGICFQVGIEAALNMAVVTGTVPNTGISLPFFSYGGSALLMILIEMGMVLSVSRSIEKKPRRKNKNEQS